MATGRGARAGAIGLRKQTAHNSPRAPSFSVFVLSFFLALRLHALVLGEIEAQHNIQIDTVQNTNQSLLAMCDLYDQGFDLILSHDRESGLRHTRTNSLYGTSVLYNYSSIRTVLVYRTSCISRGVD